MGCAVPVLLYSSFWQLGSPHALHIHVKLCLTMKLQSPDTLLQNTVDSSKTPAPQYRGVDISPVSQVSASHCSVSSSHKHLGDGEILGLRRASTTAGDENETAHHLGTLKRKKLL